MDSFPNRSIQEGLSGGVDKSGAAPGQMTRALQEFGTAL